MATADSVRAKMQGLIDSANAKTGGNDTTLTAAVNALIAGFGQGGGYETITLATSATIASDVYQIFNPLAHPTKTTVFIKETQIKNNSPIVIAFNVMGTTSGWMRYRDGQITGSSTWADAYDLAIDIGDIYIKWVIE